MQRRGALSLIGGALALTRCSPTNAVQIGSKNFTESFLLAELYAQQLERAGISVVRRFNLGSTEILLAALTRGEIDCYPEYTGTALVDVLHHAPLRNESAVLSLLRHAFVERYRATWLDPAPMNDSQALATTRAISSRLNLRTLSECARLAPQLRLATIQEFLARPDGLPGLKAAYGGFDFKSIHTYDIALKYAALLSGDADVATAFTTDGAIAAHELVVLRDDRGFWPTYHAAPVVRQEVLARSPRIRTLLDRLSATLTTARVRAMNERIEAQQQSPAIVARAFLASMR
ncbi:MAG TPA: glycine betaine ABC transporter substrate-binding protein [Candidatus Dormibacteraeota bacterium]|nr:glycine betaine ABC transporter substrate-binding protein [Candidatus Dormibacteraeota bacterium]